MFTVAATLVTLAVLFILTALGLAAGGRLGHPFRVVAGLAALLALGLVLLVE